LALKRFAHFLLCGGVAAALNWGSRILFSELVPFHVAVVFAFLVGMLSGFTLMRVFVFNGVGKPIVPQLGKYVAINLFGLTQTLVISLVLATWLLPYFGVAENKEALAHLVGVLFPVMTSYCGHKFLTFR